MTRPPILIVGLGVVGRAIAQAHTKAKRSLTIADQSLAAVQSCLGELQLDPTTWRVSEPQADATELAMLDLVHRHGDDAPRCASANSPRLLIESIAERLQVKRDFFQQAERCLDQDWIFCSNTSTLRIADIAAALSNPSRLCGMHFFMPVASREAVEVIPTDAMSEADLAAVTEHVRRLDRTPLIAADSPGFIVNRMLSPYLNEAMTLLAQGATAEQIEQAALRFGMPLSPLELIDLIGSRTMFDAGRVYWQSFPSRIDPSPMLPAMIKAGRGGRFGGGGFYNYPAAGRSAGLAAEADEIRDRYTRQTALNSDDEVRLRLSIPMWIEAALLLRERVAKSLDQVEIAMAGGLGYTPRGEWFRSFDALGSETIRAYLNDDQLNVDHPGDRPTHSKSLSAPLALKELLAHHCPSDAITRFADLDAAST
ncbi:MAG: 3-hydroxyacyl-CoA dehydrogenase family protein [Novipirellula sp. JB048]